MYLDRTGGNTLYTFESWGDYLKYVSPSNPVGDCPLKSREVSHTYSRFSKTDNFDEAMQLAVNGWREGAERVKKISEPIFAHVSSLVERHSVVHDVEGIQVDVARFLDGEPECWQQWEPQQIIDNSGVRMLKIAFNGSISGGIRPEVIESVGSVMTALIELLEYSGTRCEVWYSINFREVNIETRVKIKAADQPLDVPRLAFVLAHPSSLRRLGFSFMEQQSSTARKQLGIGYGASCEQSLVGDINVSNQAYNNPELRDPKSAEQWIINQLREQGVDLKVTSEV